MHSTVPLPSEGIHTPNPHPARGIYGFALYIVGWICLVAYLIWAFVPTPILNKFGITYVPAKAWAILFPCVLCSLTVIYPGVLLLVNIFRFRGVFDTVDVSEIHRRLADFERRTRSKRVVDTADDYKVESMMAEQQIQLDTDKFGRVLQKRQEERSKNIEQKIKQRHETITFPLAHSEKIQYSSQASEQDDRMSKIPIQDRGFYVDGDTYVDDYRAASIYDLPEDQMIQATSELFGPEDAAEHIAFQLPGQANQEADDLEGDAVDWTEQYGTVDLSQPQSSKQCGGCGANFHCKDASLPGFVPLEVLQKVNKNKASTFDQLCKRCHLLKHHNFLLNVNVCSVDYAAMMSQLKTKEEALILLVVDVTDLPGSIHRQLPHIIGEKKPMIVVGNKVDLLPPDARTGYLKRFKLTVEAAIREAGFLDKFNILHTALISAKTGYGIEELITEIHLKWTNAKLSIRTDMYLVGCTNAGKSTLFNAFLQSDLCKVRAVDLVQRATTSIWPGTTISLLKFPVMKLSPYRLEIRRRRLLAGRAWLQKENYMRKLALQRTGDSKYAVLTGLIQNTYKEHEEELQPIALSAFEKGEVDKQGAKEKWSLRDEIFTKGTWCFDTPGTVNDSQVLSQFTLSELIKVLPRKLLTPRTCIIAPGARLWPITALGNCLVIGGVGIIEILATQTGDAVLLTSFVSDSLPLNVMPTRRVTKFLQENISNGSLIVPSSDPERLQKWPKLEGKLFDIYGDREQGAADLILSSIGWVLLTTPNSATVRIRVPDGRGIAVRSPILPFAAELRGKRLPGSAFYEVKPVQFPVNVRRHEAAKRQRQKRRSV